SIEGNRLRRSSTLFALIARTYCSTTLRTRATSTASAAAASAFAFSAAATESATRVSTTGGFVSCVEVCCGCVGGGCDDAGGVPGADDVVGFCPAFDAAAARRSLEAPRGVLLSALRSGWSAPVAPGGAAPPVRPAGVAFESGCAGAESCDPVEGIG